MTVQGNGPIVVDVACVFEAEDVVQVNTVSRAMDVGEAICVCKALVVVIGVEGFKETISLVDGGDVLFPQGFDESILMCSIGALDTSSGLWRVGSDVCNGEGSYSTTELC